MLANYHTHTYRCRHAEGEDREYVESAIESGLKVLGFSDHCPWIFPDRYASAIRMDEGQVEDYFTSLTALKKEYADDITIYIGFEAEYLPPLMEAQERLLEGYPLDYMIMGQHFVEPEPFGDYMGRPTDSEEVLKRYIDSIIAGMETGKYKYVAHPDLLAFEGDREIFRSHYSRLCRYLKEKNIPVEINLLGVRNFRHYPSEEFLAMAHNEGNSAIIGCDAHQPELLNYKAGVAICESLAEKYELPLVDYLEGLGPEK